MKKSFRFDAVTGHAAASRGVAHACPRGPRQQGFTLIEVMVALIVLVLGVLGAAAMTLNAIRDSKQSGLRTQASALAYEISDLMRANRYWGYPQPLPADYPAFPLPQYQEAVFTGAVPTTGVATCWTIGCIPSDMAKNDYYEWRRKLTDVTTGLPNGDAVICHDATLLSSYPACDNSPSAPLVVKLKWDEKLNNARGAAATTSGVVTQYMTVVIRPY